MNAATENHAYSDSDELIEIKVGGNTVKSFGYDAAGRTTGITYSGATTTLAYDYESRITSISRSGVTTNTFTYNGLDTRVGKVDSGGTKTYKRDGAYMTDPVLSDGAANYTPGISERRSGSTKYNQQDHLGSFTRQTDSSQATSGTRSYDAFGLPTGTTQSPTGPFGFAGGWGYQEDGDHGFKLLGHRYYDVSTGRFLTRDPIRAGKNWYSYCSNKPTRAVDPLGLFMIGWGFEVGGQFFSGSGSGGVSIWVDHTFNVGLTIEIGGSACSGFGYGGYAGTGLSVGTGLIKGGAGVGASVGGFGGFGPTYALNLALAEDGSVSGGGGRVGIGGGMGANVQGKLKFTVDARMMATVMVALVEGVSDWFSRRGGGRVKEPSPDSNYGLPWTHAPRGSFSADRYH